MEEKEELVSMEEVKLDIMEDKASLDSPVAERFNLEKRFHMNQMPLKELKWSLSRMNKSELEKLNAMGRSALHFAARYSKVELVEYLLERGMEVDALGEEGMTALHYVSRYARTEYIRVDLGGGCSASVKNSTQTMQLLLAAGADKNKGDVYGLTPLHHIAMRGNRDLLQQLLPEQPDLDAQDLQECTPLHLAATYGHLEIFQDLREAGADLFLLNDQRQNVLHKACQEGHWAVVEDILTSVEEEEKREELVQAKDNDGNCATLMAAMAGGADNAGKLAEAFQRGGTFGVLDEPNVQGECAIHYAARAGDLSMLVVLLDAGANINKQNSMGHTALFLAAENVNPLPKSVLLGQEDTTDDLSLVQHLLERGADKDLGDADGVTPIMIAAIKGHTEVVNELMKNEAKLEERDVKDHTILHYAAMNNRHEVLSLLATYNQELVNEMVNMPNYMENTALHLAAQAGHLQTVKELLRKKPSEEGEETEEYLYKVDVDNKNWDEQTPSHLAAAEGHSDVLRVLLYNDPHTIFDKDEEDNTPLHLAATRKQSHTVEALLAAGASLQKRNRSMWTPLDCAAAAGCRQCCELLINSGSELDPVDRSKLTPLHLAASNGHSRVVQLLLEKGANICLEDRDGYNALELAIKAGHQCVVEVLLDCSQWKRALRTVHAFKKCSGEIVPDTPLRMLVRRFPDLAEKVMDACITQKENDIMEFDFQFLDDTYSLERENKDEEVIFKYKKEYEEEEADYTCYDGNGTVSMENHPLMLMVIGQNKALLRHPLSLALLRRKWRMFGRMVFYLQFLHYIFFLISITSYILIKLTFDSYQRQLDKNEANTTKCIQDRDDQNKMTLLGLRIAVFVAVIIAGVIEISELIRMKSRYFRFSNLVDWVLYVLSFVFVLDLCIKFETAGCEGQQCWQWPVGSFLVTVAWLNFLKNFRYVPYFGIFILMINYIIHTVAKFAVILVIFIVAFALGFHILFINQMAFDSTPYSMLKTVVMMIGEYEFEGIFTEHDNPEDTEAANLEAAKMIPFPTYSSLVFLAFVFVMSIIIMNLMVGLAVDDITEIQNNAELQKLSLNTRLVLESERFLGHLRCCLSNSFLKSYTQSKHSITRRGGWVSTFLRDILSKGRIWESVSQREVEKQVRREEALERLLARQEETAVLVRGLVEQMEELRQQGKGIKRQLKAIQDEKDE